jgi:hypothetical protein
VSRRSALIAIVELVEKFIHKLGTELSLAGEEHSNPSTLVVKFKNAF